MIGKAPMLKGRMLGRNSLSCNPVAPASHPSCKNGVRPALLACQASSSLAAPAPIAPEPDVKHPDCTMTMSMEDEDDNGAPTYWEGPKDAQQTKDWAAWMGRQLSTKLVGLTAHTSRAQIRTLAVNSAAVVKGRIRAHNLEFVLSIEGTHLKIKDISPIRGSIRVSLKTVDKKDAIHLSELQWDAEAAALLPPGVHADLRAAADSPLESALAIHLNDILWDVEKRSLDSMDE